MIINKSLINQICLCKWKKIALSKRKKQPDTDQITMIKFALPDCVQMIRLRNHIFHKFKVKKNLLCPRGSKPDTAAQALQHWLPPRTTKAVVWLSSMSLGVKWRERQMSCKQTASSSKMLIWRRNIIKKIMFRS